MVLKLLAICCVNEDEFGLDGHGFFLLLLQLFEWLWVELVDLDIVVHLLCLLVHHGTVSFSVVYHID